ncbi:phosphate propanoyltransferase [Ruminococcaceae bacterium OttesenSCG-928-N02]|nr:phosphate propanoyltransferase [Ruminococcaceae bacterium OttesenSCG-928-N02]
MDKFIVETSARHIHVTQEVCEALFGAGHQLTVKKYLSQPGEFASEERVDVIGPKREMKNVSILGPVRAFTQVELAATDCRSIGIEGVVRESGSIEGTPGCILRGPAGEVELKEGVIVAKRHIHMTPEDAAAMGVENKQIVSVACGAGDRSLVFGDVVVRVSEKFATAMHIDTDESNAAGGPTQGTIVK